MRRYLCWYRIILKQLLKKADFIIPLILIFAAIYGIAHLNFSGDEYEKIGYFVSGSEELPESYRGVAASDLTSLLSKESGTLRFLSYDSEESLREAVQEGSVKCGFVIPPVIEDADGQISWLITEAAGASSLAKETLYTRYLDLLSKDLLHDFAWDEEFYVPGNEEERYEYIKERYAYYRDSTDIFRVVYETVDGKNVSSSEDPVLLPGLIGLSILVLMMLNAQTLFSDDRTELNKKITTQNKLIFQFLEIQAAGIVLAAAAAVLWCIERRGSASVLMKGFLISLLFSALCAFWIFIYLRFFRTSLQYNSILPVTLLFNLLICPVIFDASLFFPALKYVQYLFPVTWYCRMAAFI